MNAVTLRIWNALQRPPLRHPLFRRMISLSRRENEASPVPMRARVGLLVFSFGFIFASLRLFPEILIILIFVVPLGAGAIYMLLHGTLAGAVFATRISAAIARERERGTLELLSMSPQGGFAATWAICTGCQYYDQTFKGQGARRVWFARFIFVSVMTLSSLLALASPRAYGGRPFEALALMLVGIMVVSLAFHIDDVHSLVLGSLVGLVVPVITRHRFDARLWALLTFLLLQVVAYTLTWVVGLLIIPQLYEDIGLTGFTLDIAIALEVLLVFFATREVLAQGLWLALRVLMDDDLDAMLPILRGN